MIPKYNIGDIVSSNGIKGSVSAIELNSMITANVQPYYVVSMECGKELLPESSLQLTGIFNSIKQLISSLLWKLEINTI